MKIAVTMMSNANMELPYEGPKEMLLVDELENHDFLIKLVEVMFEELPSSKKKIDNESNIFQNA